LRVFVVDIALVIDQTLRELDVNFWLPERGHVEITKHATQVGLRDRRADDTK
jgi:hypothetical protein